jgi:hypothetical protein
MLQSFTPPSSSEVAEGLVELSLASVSAMLIALMHQHAQSIKQ